MSPWNPWASLTTSHYSIAVGNRGVFGKNNGSSGSGQTTGFTVQNLRAARHNGQSKQIKLQRFGRFKSKVSGCLKSFIQVSPCRVAQYRLARKIRMLFCGIGFGPVFPEFCGPQRHITGTCFPTFVALSSDKGSAYYCFGIRSQCL